MSDTNGGGGAAVADAPVASPSKKEANKARIQALKDAKARSSAGNGEAADPTQPKATKAKKEKAPKTVRACRCGCGGQTTAYFVPGHDARFKGWLKKIERGEMEPKDLPKAVHEGYTWTQRGKGFVPNVDYKGNPYVPQISAEEAAE